MSEVADLYVTLRANIAQFTSSMAEAGAASDEAEASTTRLGDAGTKMAFGVVAAGAVVAGVAIDMASKFQDAMTRIQTESGVPHAAIAGLSNDVLNLAGKVGDAPGSLADALYHIESTFASTGISGQKAMDILKTAAEGAKIGGADLTDVTNALDAAVVSGIPGVQNYSQAMGMLLAIVGSGDMTMQNLADAMSTGIMAVAKQYGASLSDVGAALATFGDNNIRGAQAATDLRMVIMDLTKQSAGGTAALAKIGLTAGQLGQDMQTGGLNKAVTDLHDHLNAAGITGAAVGTVLEDAFTKKSSAPLAILLGEFDQFESKYPELAKGANTFGSSWAAVQDTFKQKMSEVKATVDELGIRLGTVLLPIVSKVADVFMSLVGFFERNRAAVLALGAAVGSVLAVAVGAVVVAIGGLIAGISAATWIFAGLIAAVAATAAVLVNLYKNNAGFRQFVDDIGSKIKAVAIVALNDLKTAFEDVKTVISNVITAVIGWYEKHKAAVTSLVNSAKSTLTALWQAFTTVFDAIVHVVGTIITGVISWYDKHKAAITSMLLHTMTTVSSILSAFRAAFDAISAVVSTVAKIIEDLWARFGQHLLSHIVTGFNAIMDVVRGAFEVIKGIFEIVTGILTGKWSKAWQGIKDVFAGVWKIIVGILKAAVNVVSEVIGAAIAVVSAIWDAGWHMVSTLFSAAWGRIKTLTSQGVSDIVGFFTGLWNQAWALTSQGISEIVNFFVGLWNQAWSLTSQGINEIVGFFTGLWNDAKTLTTQGIAEIVNGVVGFWHAVTGFFTNLWNDARNLVTSGVNDVIGFFQHLGAAISGAVSDAWHAITGFFTNMWNDARNAVTSGVNDVVNFVGGLPSRITGILGDLGSLLYNAGHAIIEGLLNGIKAAFNDVKNFVSGIGSWIASHKGPIDYDRALLIPHGQAMMDGLREGLSNGFAQVQADVQAMSASIANNVTVKGTVTATATLIPPALQDLFAELRTAAAGGAGVSVQDVVEQIFAEVRTAGSGGAGASSLPDVMREVMDTVREVTHPGRGGERGTGAPAVPDTTGMYTGVRYTAAAPMTDNRGGSTTTAPAGGAQGDVHVNVHLNGPVVGSMRDLARQIETEFAKTGLRRGKTYVEARR